MKIESSESEKKLWNDMKSIELSLEPSSPNGLVNFTQTALKYVSSNGKSIPDSDKYIKIGEKYNMRFKLVNCNRHLLKTVLHSFGFEQCSPSNPFCNLIWVGGSVRSHVLRSLQPWQRINHFPRSSQLTRKDKLYENIARARNQFGSLYDFIPESFVMPKDKILLSKSLQTDQFSVPYIVKPVSSSRGNGIYIIHKLSDIHSEPREVIVSRYISNPFLLNGHKFDLRLYVVVTSFHPLVAYMYYEGLTRFACEKYTNESDENEHPLAHLTNYSLNKHSDVFVKNLKANLEDVGHKWTLGGLLRRLESEGIDTQLLMLRVEDLVVKSLLSVQSPIAAACRNLVPFPSCCFELFGFDVLIDSDLKPWLLEVNLSPSLSCTSTVRSTSMW
ncbi:hypothetical protein AB6A40_010697 [Gnathostoma spinigerum]|uniref:Tubulin--tyrosine ligase-like protein 5 n=1 Tax=Gnathostoma spinigerum TaxID=75299 RepID=A0ABD6EW25_9BILA